MASMKQFKHLTPGEISENKRLLGERIQQRRAELDLTQEEVAQLGGISSETVRQYEIGRGGDQPQERTLESIDAALGWCLGSTKAALLRGEEPKIDHTSKRERETVKNHSPRPMAPMRTTTPQPLPRSNSQATSQVSVDRDQLRQLVNLTTGLLANAARTEDPKDLLGDLAALNRLAYEMTLAAV